MFCEHCQQVVNITACMLELEMKQRTSLNIQLCKKQKQKGCFILISLWGDKLEELLVSLTSEKADPKALHYYHNQFF